MNDVGEWLGLAPFDQKVTENEIIEASLDLIKKQAMVSTTVKRWFGISQDTKWLEISDMPFLPVQVFKNLVPVVTKDTVVDIRESSGTTVGGTPSCVCRDEKTLMYYKKSRNSVLDDFCVSDKLVQLAVVPDPEDSPNPRLSANLVVDVISNRVPNSNTHYVVTGKGNDLNVDIDAFIRVANANSADIGLVFGHTAYLYLLVVEKLKQRNVTLNLSSAVLLYGWGWKKYADKAVDDNTFRKDISKYLGILEENIYDMYGFAESNTLYLQCEYGWRHAPKWEHVIIRDPITLDKVADEMPGLLQIISPLPQSYPGVSLLVDDIAIKQSKDVCNCGRQGSAFKIVGRASKDEVKEMEVFAKRFVDLEMEEANESC